MQIVRNQTQKIYRSMLDSVQLRMSQFAILIDPEDFVREDAERILSKIPQHTTHIFVGGSSAGADETHLTVSVIKQHCKLPVILFPGDYKQITTEADSILFLSLLSGNNPEYLIHQQVKSVPLLKMGNVEIIPTGYILIDGGNKSAVERVSGTSPIAQDQIEKIVHIALAGEYSGKKIIYLEAGSGAKIPVSKEIITAVKNEISIPLIVGGGIRSKDQMEQAYAAGADLVVVGTAFEQGTICSDQSISFEKT